MEAGSAQQIWEAALGELQIQVSKSNYRTWLEKTAGLGYQDNKFVIGVPNTFVAEYLDQKQRSLIEKTLIGVTGRNLQVRFQVDAAKHATPGSPTLPEEASSGFNPRYTFDDFITGNCNRLAYAASLAIAEKPGDNYNPLFIYGGPGLGKTHLLHAIGHMAQLHHFQTLYVSGEQFTNEFIQAIQLRKTEEFRNKYRKVDMLLIDDINFITGKEQTQECFFHTFNELHNNNRQIAVTSDRSPKSMPQLEERLCSRFQWGLTVDIQSPDLETRMAILQAKAEQKGQNLTMDVLDFIAQRIEQNVRELEGSLNRVIAYAKLLRALVTPELAAKALESIATKPGQGTAVTPSLIIDAVADNFQLAPVEMKSRKRDRETALARQVAMYLIKEETHSSLAQIGHELGNRNPATVSHAYAKIAAELNDSPYLRHKISDIRARIHPRLKGRKK